MAVIGKIRKHSGLLVVVVGIALAAFVLGDFLRPSGNRPITIIGKIDGTEIPIQNYNDRVAEQLENLRAQQQTERVPAEEEFQIRQQVWNQIIEETILNDVYKKIGLIVTKEELSNEIIGDNPNRYVQQSFRDPNSETFDPEVVRNFLKNLNQQGPEMKRRYLSLERMVKDDIIRTKMKNLLSKNYHIPQPFAKLDYQIKNQNADVIYVAAKYSDVADSLINVTDNDLRNYYNDHIYNYRQEDSRTFDYVLFEILPTQEDRQDVKEEVDRLYVQFKDAEDPAAFINSVSDTRFDSTYKKESDLPISLAESIMSAKIDTVFPPYIEGDTHHIIKVLDFQQRPDSIEMSQMLVSYSTARAGFQLNERSEEEAKVLVDSILTALKKAPSIFEELALKYSDYPSVAEDKGALGWMTDGDRSFTNFFKEGVSLKVNEPDTMETGLGIHVLLVTGKTALIPKVKIGQITRTVEPSSQTYRQVFSQANKFASENRTLAKFDTAVVNQGLNKRTAERISSTSNRIPGVEQSRQIIRWAFWETTKVGDVSTIFEDDKQFVIAALKEIKNKGYSPFEQVKEQIRPLVVNKLKGEYLVKKINDFNATTLNDLASNMNSKVDTAKNLSFSARNIPGFGSEPNVIGQMFTVEPKQISKPIAGYNAVFVAMIDRLTPAPEVNDFGTTIFQLRNSFESRVNSNAFIRALEKESKIEDNRLMFY
ncbi:MAG TPA: SurA N-terminal domain-containing protein [Bacteroidales bacterium]|jgi:peptidyl-prolyl cis-trans isomerase D|nr:SurA N-terminal domain-containing protein [Bacteroidales bacterium]OQC37347.1 MAG: peptidyl-prolyl cis-trans isomerase SurA [Bacteroidetes bacterium ADurb.Bin041]MBP7873168.1 SurA N-terminal domain-containing protein [Bacteroidales bacterium]MCZ2283170.1 SurA N-terminal domain-containing protein [Bacteroidales bacterium]HNV50174.1 SurA N-terminal domain-containing protein [Bacteroidales bacterium]